MALSLKGITVTGRAIAGQSITGPVDPYFSNVALLLHLDGTNNSTTFTDNSPSPRTLTPSGNAKIVTNDYVFPTGSAYFDGTGDYITSNSAAGLAFGTGDFTVEFRWKPATWTNNRWIISNSTPGSGTLTGVYHLVTEGTTLDLKFENTYTGLTAGNLSALANTWIAVAFRRNAGNLGLYINGTRVGATNITNNANLSNQNFRLGAAWDGLNTAEEHFDEVRLTKGISRYNGASYTLDTQAFPNQ
jgi:hypothetical protein